MFYTQSVFPFRGEGGRHAEGKNQQLVRTLVRTAYRISAENFLSVQFQNHSQHTMSGRMLRTKNSIKILIYYVNLILTQSSLAEQIY